MEKFFNLVLSVLYVTYHRSANPSIFSSVHKQWMQEISTKMIMNNFQTNSQDYKRFSEKFRESQAAF